MLFQKKFVFYTYRLTRFRALSNIFSYFTNEQKYSKCKSFLLKNGEHGKLLIQKIKISSSNSFLSRNCSFYSH